MDLLTTTEAAEFLHVPVATLRHWQATGKAPRSARMGKRRMWRREDLEAWTASKFEEVGAPVARN